MQISTVKIRKLNSEMRIDAEYYRIEILKHVDILEKKKNTTLNHLVEFVVGPFGSTVTVDKYVKKSKYRYVRNKDINEFIINDSEPALIPADVYDLLPQFHLKENDLLITVVGTLGKVAIARRKDENSIFSCKSTILRAQNINPYYLLTYLNSPTGQLFCLRGKRGAIQEGLNLFDLKEIKVFLPDEIFQLQFEKIIKKLFSLLEKSHNFYTQAEQLLLDELGLSGWQEKHELTFVKNFSDTEKVGRIDAEYFQTKYDEIINAAKQYKGGWDTLDNLAKITKSIEPGSSEYKEEGIKFLRVSNLSKFGLDNSSPVYLSEKLYKENKQHQPKKGEILLSKDATLGIAYYLNEKPEEMIVSGGILRLKLKDERINEDYLALALNSVIVQEQAERDAGGSVIKHWRPDQIKNVIIPLLDKPIQTKIQQKIRQSFETRHKSKQLLEIAKQAVEMAIEKDEKTAMDWINKHLEG